MNTTKDPFGSGETEVSDRPPVSLQGTEPPATEKQVAFIRRLREERGIDVNDPLPGGATKRSASAYIEKLLAMPKQVDRGLRREPPEGIHVIFRGDTPMEIYKVQVAVHGSGRKYAKALNMETGEFEYAGRRPLFSLSKNTLMTLEQAKTFGHLYGMCVRCGATLTDEKSIAMGIGPVCAGKF